MPPAETESFRYARQGAALCQERRTIERYLDAKLAEDPQEAILLLSANHCWLTGSERAVRRVTKKSRYREMGLARVRLWGSVSDYWVLTQEMCGGREACRRASPGVTIGN